MLGCMWLVFIKDDFDMVCEVFKVIILGVAMENNGEK